MRIAFISHCTTLYGANRSLLGLIEGLRRYDVVPHVVAPEEGDVTAALRSRAVPVVALPLEWWMAPRDVAGFDARHAARWVYGHLQWRRRAVRRLWANVRVLPALVRQLRAWHIDVIYTNSSVTPIGALASGWLRLPHVWHLREFGGLDFGLQHDWGTAIFRHGLGSADAIVAISDAVRSCLLKGVSARRVYTIYNGVTSEAHFQRLYEAVQVQSDRKQAYTFALVGVIHASKGQETAIRALAIAASRHPGIRLLIVGALGDTCQLKRMAAELGVTDKVEFWGYVPDPYEAYLAADAVLMCSKHEGMGRVTAEAMAACRPVIGYRSGGTSEIIEHEHTGLLYRDGPEALAACMMRFIEDPEWARRLGENGWHVASKKYSIEVYAEGIYRVLHSVSSH
jgi:glycosyltransferase involved in cell wall biosynthesis